MLLTPTSLPTSINPPSKFKFHTHTSSSPFHVTTRCIMNPIIIIVFITTLHFLPVLHSLNSDGLSLLALKAAITNDPTKSLTTWSENDVTPCHWTGIACSSDHRVTSIFLPHRNLTGYLPSELGALVYLKHLVLSYNNFTKLIPDHLFNASSLMSLDLSHNSLAGNLPEKVGNLKFLSFLDVSDNMLNGSLPVSLGELGGLSGTVNLSWNMFSGEIPVSYGLFPVMVSLDLRYNNLTGKVPLVGSLLNQGPTAFAGNPYLCGFPLQTQCSDPEAQNPRGVLTNPDAPKDLGLEPGQHGSGGSGSVMVGLISGVSVVIGVVIFSMWVYRKRWKAAEGKLAKRENMKQDIDVIVKDGEGQDGKFVVMDEGFALELEDLLRASAYVVGKSKSGIVYKVVAGRGGAGMGAVVAVRRLSEGDGVWRLKEFEAEVEAIGKVQHPNIVRLRAYYYANDEKLLVSDFISNGSLYSALHDAGGPANPSPPLSWASRLKIAQGTARGLAHIHECSPRKHVHGNIKSSKILLDDDLQPFISGFGLNRLVSATISKSTSRKLSISSQMTITSSKSSFSSSSPSTSSSSHVYYVAPEARISGHKPSPKCDVYSFGIVLLEMLTGRSPDGGGLDNDGKGLESFVRKVFREERPLSEIIDPVLLQEVHAKKQVVAAFHVALNCTELDPEVRPKMRIVSDSLDRIKLQ
ncbi:leucine-rich repeat protein kinase family protein [Artemisia annua]|uniref:Leucine-rich repeat protein kinase family protein n=1 Tax=Artemisia annua TaxID=35608 RepID=A0A2U1MKT3_ARTAN|nr:leucine-rich repeat protein kinase family protein [Artemisia annua]